MNRPTLWQILVRVVLGLVAQGLVVAALGAAPATRQGFAAHYRAGLMEQVARRRGLPDRGCLVASPYEAIGSRLQVASRRGTLHCTVVDVCHPRHCAAIRRRGLVVELDAGSNRRLCPPNERPERCPVRVTHLR
jgi:hypothetical protein